MSGNRKWNTAAAAAGAVAFATLIGCGREPGVASNSAAAFREAQKEGKTFEDAGHGTAHEGHAAPEREDHTDHSAMGHGGGQHATEHAPDHGAEQHAAHGSPAGKRQATPGHDHAGHSQLPAAGHDHAAPRPAAPGHDHAGHPASGGAAPARPVADLPAQPAGILRPDRLDAPAATSVLDAQRSAEINREMSHGHGGHGSGTYRHVDAGRGPGAYEGSEPQTPGAGPQHHDHGAAQTEKKEAGLYACPMHPEVTSKTPGTCPKCGMALVERREE